MDESAEPRLHKPGVAGSNPAAANISHEPAEVYHGWPEPSASGLKTLDTSPLEYQQRFVTRTAPQKTSDALSFGTLLHLWAELQDDAFWPRVVSVPAEYVTATGSLNQRGKTDWLPTLAADAIPLAPKVQSQLEAQTRQILANPIAAELLATAKDREFNCRFLYDRHPMRCRVDGATDELFFDLKTTSDFDPAQTFVYSCRQWRYHLQAAVYERAGRELGWPKFRLTFIASSNLYPHHCAVLVLPPAVQRLAERRVSELLNELEARLRLDWWAPRCSGRVIEMPAGPFLREGAGT